MSQDSDSDLQADILVVKCRTILDDRIGEWKQFRDAQTDSVQKQIATLWIQTYTNQRVFLEVASNLATAIHNLTHKFMPAFVKAYVNRMVNEDTDDLVRNKAAESARAEGERIAREMFEKIRKLTDTDTSTKPPDPNKYV